MDDLRKTDLEVLFAGCTAGLVLVSAFPTRSTWRLWSDKIAWETEIWIAAEPTHLIHYNGDRFLGPH